MAGKLSFSIAINLLTENFKRGTNNVKSGLRAMQMQVLTFAAALGAGGLGLSGFISQLITVARETSRVTTALKNISGGMSQYADNQKFVIDMAKKYGLEINALTGNFAKFTAASQVSGMSMMDQRKIFESVSRACTAFGMSADDSNGVFLALSQMMSKGKISSEELRLQMGERLPVALQAMAKAAGVSVGGLDKLMKKGKLMSADVLPKFADALNEMIPNVDTDNLETSANRLKNAFTKFTKGTDIQSTYKGLIDWLTGAVQSAGENIKNIVLGVVAVISGIVINSVVKWWAAMGTSAAQLEAAALRSNTALIAATEARIAAEIALENAKVAANNATGAAALAAKKRVIQAQNALTSASAAEQVAIENVKAAELKILEAKILANAKTAAVALAAVTRKKVAAEIEFEAAKNGVLIANNTQILAAQQRLATAQTALAKLTAKEIAAQEAAKAAAAQAASIKSATWWGRACTTMKAAGAKLVVSLKTMWSSFAPMIIFSAIVAIIGKLTEMYQEAKRIKNIFSDYKKESQLSGYTQEVVILKQQLKIMNDKKQSQENINGAQAQLQKMLGDEHASQEKLNKLVAKRVELLKETARSDFHARKVVESEEALREVGNKTYNGKTVRQMAPDWAGARGDQKKEENFKQKYGITSGLKELEFAYGDFKNDLNSYLEQANILKHSTTELEKSQIVVNKAVDNPVVSPDPDPDDKKEKKTPLQKEQGSYDKQFAELGAELEIGKITQAEYNQALGDLNIKMYAQAKGTGDKEVLESEYYKIRKEAAEKAVKDQDKNTALVEFEKVQKEYNDALDLAKVKLDKKLIPEDEYREAIIDAATSAADSAVSIKGIGDAANGFIAEVQGKAIAAIEAPALGKRDATFDYKATDSDKISGELDVWTKYKEELEGLKEKHHGLSEDLQNELNNAIANVDNLEEALKLAEVKEDIKNFSKELNQMEWDGFKGAVSNIDGMVSAFQRLQDAFDPESEADGWEKLMAIWNTFTSVVDGIMSVIKTIESITELTNMLTDAKEKEVAMDTAATATKATNAVTGAAAESAALGVQTTSELTASAAKTTAATVEMAAKSTAAYAAIPFAGVGFATAQIASMKSLILAAAVPFATGGIVKHGPTSGDRILARVNAGEMILNGGQQSNLFDAINSGKLGSNSPSSLSVATKIRSKDLILIINNELKSQGKKPIS